MIAGIVYFVSIVLSIGLASHYKKIDDIVMKRNYGASLGISIACLICGFQIYHTVLMLWGNILIIKSCSKRSTDQQAVTQLVTLELVDVNNTRNVDYIHQLSMAYTWAYLMYLHYNGTECYVKWLHQVLALRLVGLSFELHNADKNKKNMKAGVDKDVLSVVPSTADIVAYTYFFIGIHKGPYYRWKIYQDHFITPFGTIDDCREITIQKLMKTGICGMVYLILRVKYTPDVYYDDKFYKYYGTDFRFLYNIPQLLMYILRWQILMLLSTAVCTEAGFGVYPDSCAVIPGFGPSDQLCLEKLTDNTQDPALQQYNFAMLKCFDHEKLLIGPKMKDTLRSWNMPTRYWFWANVYKNLTKCNTEVKSACSFFAWTVWSGPSLQQVILSTTLWVYVHLEAEYNELYNTSEEMKLPWDIGFSIMRILCLIYLTPCLIISDVDVFFNYYNSIYWMFHVVMLGLIVGSLVLQKTGLFNHTHNI